MVNSSRMLKFLYKRWKKLVLIFPYFSLFFYRLNSICLNGQKYGLIGNVKSFKKMWLLPTDIQTQRRNKIFSIFPYFSFFFNRLNIIGLGRQKYGFIGNFKSFKKIGLLPTDIQTQRRNKIISIFPYFSLFLLANLMLSDGPAKIGIDR